MIGFVAPFKILDYVDRLNIVKETSSEYHCTCPVCGDGGFKINKSNGKYQAFKCGCEVKDIRESIRPWSEVGSQRKRGDWGTEKQSFYPKISLARLPQPAKDIPAPEQKPVPAWLVKQGVPASAVETRYWYSKTQWVSRFEWQTPEGKQKTIRQGHIKSNGLVQWKKGPKEWKAYRLTEAVAQCKNKWVLGVEGEGCVESARSIGLAGITWLGSKWNSKETKQKTVAELIASDLKKLKTAGAGGLVYFPDYDPPGEKKAEIVSSACQLVDLPCLILSPTDVWSRMPEKGDISDWVKAYPDLDSEELKARLEKAIAIAKEKEQQNLTLSKDKELEEFPAWSQSDIALWLASKHKNRLVWNTELQEWYRYGSVTEGIWSKEPIEFVGQLIKSEVEAIAAEIAKSSKRGKKPSYSVSFINGVKGLVKLDLAVRKWSEAVNLLPLKNGVLDLETRKLLPHDPKYQLTWCLPYNYNPLAKSEPIQQWLKQTCGEDLNLVQLMRAYLLGIVTGRVDWQKFIELIGPGGSGKSTFSRVAIALVGEENVHTTTLSKLEKDKFETASIAGKRLVLINDSEKYASEVTKLKNLTGQDTLPYEVKYKQSKGGFTPDAMVIVSTNEVIQSSDYTSGLARRRISIPMLNKIENKDQKNLIEHRNGRMDGEFVPYIPGLLNWVLGMDEAEATSIIKNYEDAVPSLAVMKAQTLIETNPIADWLDNKVLYDLDAKTNIGVAKRDKDNNSDTWYLSTDKWLYASYAEYCHDTGSRPLGLRRFINLLSDLGKNQLGLEIRKGRDRFGSYFQGLKIRSESDIEAPLITGGKLVTKKSSSSTVSSINVVSRLWNLVMDKVTTVMDRVMAETTDSDSCDEYDDNLENSLKLDNTEANSPDCKTQSELFSEPREDLWSEPNKPSSVEKENSTEEIMVGDRVTISDCLGHWAWASPFEVLEIKGKMAELDMVDELVKVDRLKRYRSSMRESH